MTADRAQPIPRAQAGGKLSSRRRVGRVEEEPALYLRGGEDPPPLEAIVPERFRAVEIEIGPGKGAFMLAATELRPDHFLLGIEASAAYARYAALRLQKAGRDNAVLLSDNAKLYLADRVPEGGLARLHVYFPDPWPKRRHRKRRFFTPDVVPHLERVLEPGGWLLVCTDNAAYAGQILRVLGAATELARDSQEEHRLLSLPPGHAYAPTNFERKYREEGRRLRHYAFRRR